MKRSQFKEEQITAILREQEAGSPTADVCYKRRSIVGKRSWEVSRCQIKRLKALEDENTAEEVSGRDDAGQRGSEGHQQPKCMVRPVRARTCTGAGSRLRKCIRPLASGLRLQPGHDEICTGRSQ